MTFKIIFLIIVLIILAATKVKYVYDIRFANTKSFVKMLVFEIVFASVTIGFILYVVKR